MIKIYGQPVLPMLTRIIFWLMIVLVAAMLLVDINAFARYDARLGIGHLVKNISVTGLLGWMFFSIIIVLLSFLGMYQKPKIFLENGRKRAAPIQQDESTKVRNERR